MKKAKKAVLAVAAALVVTNAQAWDVTLFGGQDQAWESAALGAAVSQTVNAPGVGAVKAAVEYTNVRESGSGYDQYAVTATKQVVKLGPVDLGARAGVAFVDQKNAGNGFAALVGVGAALPVTKSVAVVGTADYRFGESSISAGDGWTFRAGLRVSF